MTKEELLVLLIDCREVVRGKENSKFTYGPVTLLNRIDRAIDEAADEMFLIQVKGDS